MKYLSLIIFALVYSSASQANLRIKGKPSFYRQEMTSEQQKPLISQPYFSSIYTANEFTDIARTYALGTLYEIPHLLFLIDRQNKSQIYYINTPMFQLHQTFVEKILLHKKIPDKVFNENYKAADRRFLLGTLSYQHLIDGYTYEFWEGDQLTGELLQLAEKHLKKTFFSPVIFKTNSISQEQIANQYHVASVSQRALIKKQPFLPFHTGKANGQVHIINTEKDLETIKPTDIIVLKTIPIAIPPVAAIITEQPSTVLSHVNLLAKSLNIPNAYIERATEKLAAFNQQWINIEILKNNYTITPIDPPQQTTNTPINYQSTANTTNTQLFPLTQLTVQDSIYCGSKAANLGQIKANLPPPQAIVPDGFCIPFAQYQQFMEQNQLIEQLAQMLSIPEFKNNSSYRQQALANFRQQIINAPIPSQLSNQWQEQWKKQLKKQPIFVRSSSNSEDLPHFNGAGLYTSVPHVVTPQQLETAVKTVWASIFNYEAFETRRLMQLPEDLIKMAVLIQISIDADKSGVMVTKDPFDKNRSDVTYIAAKRGLGINVVEGKAIAEQVLYSHHSKAIQTISLSEEKTQLKTNEQGGIIEQRTPEQTRILDDAFILKLVKLGDHTKFIFRKLRNQKIIDIDQDIEWAEKEGKLYILQARPYQD